MPMDPRESFYSDPVFDEDKVLTPDEEHYFTPLGSDEDETDDTSFDSYASASSNDIVLELHRIDLADDPEEQSEEENLQPCNPCDPETNNPYIHPYNPETSDISSCEEEEESCCPAEWDTPGIRSEDSGAGLVPTAAGSANDQVDNQALTSPVLEEVYTLSREERMVWNIQGAVRAFASTPLDLRLVETLLEQAVHGFWVITGLDLET